MKYYVIDAHQVRYSTDVLKDAQESLLTLGKLYNGLRILQDITKEVHPMNNMKVRELHNIGTIFYVHKSGMNESLHLVQIGLDQYKLFPLNISNRWNDAVLFSDDTMNRILEIIESAGYKLHGQNF